jgi:hypothetical protein
MEPQRGDGDAQRYSRHTLNASLDARALRNRIEQML